MVFDATYRAIVLRWCRRRLSADIAEDLTQVVLLKLFETLPKHDHNEAKGKFRSWLKAVVQNCITDYFRQKEKHELECAQGGSYFDPATQNYVDSIDEVVTAFEVQRDTFAERVIKTVRASLSEKNWDIFLRLVEQQESPAEVAASLGQTISSIYKVKYRVTQALAKEMIRASQ